MTARQPEPWLPVVGYEGFYEVSNRGQVRRVAAGQGARPGIRKQATHPSGYKLVSLSVRNVQATKRVHSLVLEAFVGPCPDGMEACHWDDDPSNNHIENLRWDTHRANCADRRRNDRPRAPRLRSTTCQRGHEYPADCRVDARGGRICPECRAAKNLRARTTSPDHCRKGHARTLANTYVDPRGKRHCRACRDAAESRRPRLTSRKNVQSQKPGWSKP